jgi:CheY-like chemotaxis protein
MLWLVALRCLMVDDNEYFLRAARTLLEQEGLVVDVAATGAEALRRAGERRPDVLLIDIDLGAERGFDLARRLDQELRSLPTPPTIILISTHDEAEFIDLIAASPATAFLTKSSLSAEAIADVLSGTRDTE